ncbi:MAG: hypothetical protein ACRD3S_19515 [Terracidiphilus sp.]
MFTPVERTNHLRRVRLWLTIFIVGLILSGITAFPLESEIRWLDGILHAPSLRTVASSTRLLWWIDQVHCGVTDTNARYPFMAYGTDWLGFAHLVIAVAFIGPWIDPVRNKWIITFGLIACAGVVPLALIAGQVRGIPVGWRLIDCSFGVVGSIPLLLCRRHIRELENQASASPTRS